jgi:putative nucleotidyltransferase-like protein
MAMRSYVDLDLLVRHHDIPSAAQQMLALGFEPAFPLAAIHAGKIPGEYLFRRSGTQHIIELHTERSFRYYPVPLPLKDFFVPPRLVALDGRDVPVLSLEDELVLNCIHGAKHFWERLMWLADIAAIVSRHPELHWQRAKQYAAGVGAVRMLCLALQLSVPAPLAAEVARDAAVRRLSLQVAQWLPLAGFAPPALWKRAAFRLSMRGEELPVRSTCCACRFRHRRGLAEGCGGWPLVALGRPPATFTTDQEVWTGPLSPASLTSRPKRSRPR